jgi:type IV pilus assembly protein PilM
VAGIAGILDIGWSAARLVLLHKGVVVYERALARSGLGQLVESLAAGSGLAIDEAERLLTASAPDDGAPVAAAPHGDRLRAATSAYRASLVQEMRIPLSYLSNQYPDAAVERLLLVGGGASIAELTEHLAADLEMDVRQVSPSDLATGNESYDEDYGPALALAMGLGRFEEP